jgi:hypothetical protein
MDAFDFKETRTSQNNKKTTSLIWNVLTGLVLLSVVCVSVGFLVIFFNPQASLNPFPPPTLVPTITYPTATNTPRIQLQPTWTPTVTKPPTATYTPRPTFTPYLTETPVGEATATEEGAPPAPTETPAEFSFVLQEGSPSAISSTGFHPDLGCDWSGVGGQVTSLNGSPVLGLFVQLGGSLGGVPIDNKLSMTGTAPQYGQAGYEFTIADRPIPSNDTLWIQLLDQANLPLSDKTYFDTFDDCNQNLIIMYFTQVK